MEGMYVCLGALIIVAPLALLIIGIVQLHQLKASVRSLVRRVGELESRASGFVASPTPVVEAMPTRAASPVAPPPLPPTIPALVAPRITPLEGPPPKHPAPPRPPIDWEAFFGVRLFAWIGGFLLLLGLVFRVQHSLSKHP